MQNFFLVRFPNKGAKIGKFNGKKRFGVVSGGMTIGSLGNLFINSLTFLKDQWFTLLHRALNVGCIVLDYGLIIGVRHKG